MKKYILGFAALAWSMNAWAGGFKGHFTLQVEIPGETLIDSVGIYQVNVQEQRVAMAFKVPIEGAKPINSRVIIDQDKGTMYSLMEMFGQKSGSRKNHDVVAEGKKLLETPFRKTGRTKQIEGTLCQEYICETDQKKVELWISPDWTLKMSGSPALMAFSEVLGETGFKGQSLAHLGVPLLAITTDKQTGKQRVMSARNIREGDVDELAFSIAGYQIMEQPQFGK